MPHSQRETEVKLEVKSAAEARRVLRAGGFDVSRQRVFEVNTVFDTAQCELRQSGRLLRVRQAGKESTATYKGPALAGRHKSREELEFQPSDPAMLVRILERLGYQAAFRYEKYRTEFRQPGKSGVATVDETPIGCFIELEGEPAWIDRTARRLGFQEADYNTASYGRLYLEWCEREGVTPTNMVFDSSTRRRR